MVLDPPPLEGAVSQTQTRLNRRMGALPPGQGQCLLAFITQRHQDFLAVFAKPRWRQPNLQLLAIHGDGQQHGLACAAVGQGRGMHLRDRRRSQWCFVEACVEFRDRLAERGLERAAVDIGDDLHVHHRAVAGKRIHRQRGA